MCLVAFSGTIQPLVNIRTPIYIFLLAISIALICLKKITIRLNNIIQIQWIILIAYLALGLIYTIDTDKLVLVLLQYLFYAFLLIMSFKHQFYEKALNIILWICTILGIIVIITIIDNNFIVNNFSFLYAETTLKSIVGRTSGNAYGGILGEVAYSAFAMNIGVAIIASKYLSQQKISVVNWIQLIIFMIGIMVSFKRSLLLIPIFAFMILFLISKKNHKMQNVIKVLVLLVGIAIIIITMFPEALDTLGRFGTETANGDVLNGRTELWEYAFDMFKQSPIFGIGYSSYTEYCYSQGYYWNYLAHNIYIELLGEVGIIGFILFIAFFMNVFIKTIKAIRREEYSEKLYLLYFSLFIQIVFLVYGMTGNPLYFPQQMIIYILSVSILSNIGTKQKEQINNV